jgi:hypothetical protein
MRIKSSTLAIERANMLIAEKENRAIAGPACLR